MVMMVMRVIRVVWRFLAPGGAGDKVIRWGDNDGGSAELVVR